MTIDKQILTPTEAAAALGYSTQTIYGFIRSGLLKAYRDPGHRSLKIAACDVEDFISTWKRIKEPVRPSKRTNDFSYSFNVA